MHNKKRIGLMSSVRIARALSCVLLATVACSPSSELDNAGSASEAVHGVFCTDGSCIDTTQAGVDVYANNAGACSGTLVAPDTFLMASHCVAFIDEVGGRQCPNSAPSQVGGGLTFYANGTTVSLTISAVDGIVVHPEGQSNVSACKSTDLYNCASPEPTAQITRTSHDLALVHISTLPDASTYPRLKVVTDINTNSGGTSYTVHKKLNRATEFGPSQLAYDLGFGKSDFGLPDGASDGIARRLRGQIEFWQPSMDVSGNDFLWPGSSGFMGCNAPVGPVNTDPTIYMTRTSSGADAFSGPLSDSGDSGSPLLVQGGNGSGQFPELPSGDIIIGVDSGGTGPGTYGPVPPGKQTMWYTPTFGTTNGSWLDSRISDFDGDGTPNYADNCPTVANDQANSNWDAELQLALPSFPSDTGLPPTDFNTWSSVTHFWSYYKGDACDPDSSTQALTSRKIDSTNKSGACNTFQCSGCSCSHGSSMGDGGGCPKTMGSGLTMDSWIGNQWGAAKTVTGTAKPAFCPCTAGNVQLCKPAIGADCPVAKDAAVPFGSEIHNFAAITQGTGSGDTYPFPSVSMNHVDPVVGYTPSTQQPNWDILSDFPSLVDGGGGADHRADKWGVLWSHVLTFNNDTGTNENAVVVNQNNHYQYGDPYVQDHLDSFPYTNCVNGPIAVPFWDPWQAVEHEIDWSIAEIDTSSGVHVFGQSTNGTEELTSRFTSNALSALSPVTSRSADWLYAADLVTGGLGRGGLRAAVVLKPGSAFITNALTISPSSIDAQASTISPPTPLPSVLFRSFSSKLDTLFDLRQFNTGFETGDLTGWITTGAAASVVSRGAHSGTYAAMVGATTPTNGDSNITTTFTAPSGTSSLTFWYKMTCPDTVTYDWATATLYDNTSGVQTTPLAKICTTNSWTQVSATMTAGHNYSLTLTSHDDNYGADPSYTLYDDLAFSTGSSLVTLGSQTLASEFTVGGGTSTLSFSSLIGDVPANPLAMTWSAGEGSLFIADKVVIDTNDSALRLLRMTPSGSTFELWRTASITNTAFPSLVYLSTATSSQLVLTIVSSGMAEMTTFDGSGNSLSSTTLSATSPTLLGPAFVNPGGVSWGYTVSGGNPSVAQASTSSFTASLCGAPWLKAHAANGSSVLVAGYNQCP